jgi:cell division protein ZapA (FtsZ GTPase activity inhibitor)
MSQQLEAELHPPVTVTIFDQPYRLRSGQGGDERVRRVASLVDERMREVATHMRSLDMTRIAVLAALNLADELESLRDNQLHAEQTHDAPARDATHDHTHDEADAAPQASAQAEPRAADARTSGERAGSRDASASRRSWFEEIFEADEEPDEARDNARRLSAELSSKLRPRRRD